MSDWALERSISLDPAYTPTLRALISKANGDKAVEKKLYSDALAAEEHHLDALMEWHDLISTTASQFALRKTEGRKSYSYVCATSAYRAWPLLPGPGKTG